MHSITYQLMSSILPISHLFLHSSQSAFTSPQLYQLRCQIVAYKLLSRQEPVPKPLMLATMGKRPNNNQQQQPQTSTSTPPVPSNNENAQPSASTTPDVPATDSNGEKPATTSNQVKPANDQTQVPHQFSFLSFNLISYIHSRNQQHPHHPRT